jgi:putative FmdB family regulatory protein
MPIYAYRCEQCGHAKDVLQKISDPALTVCPACGAGSFAKQVTAAGFQLKGSGWYVTDFKGSGAATAPKGADAPAAGATETGTAAKPSDSGTSASAPSSGCGSSCTCH